MATLTKVATVLALLTPLIFAQLQYGENQRGTIRDSDVVARAFPSVEGIELLSPAFTDPEDSPPGWSNGTDGPTGYTDFGIYDCPPNKSIELTTCQTTFTAV